MRKALIGHWGNQNRHLHSNSLDSRIYIDSTYIPEYMWTESDTFEGEAISTQRDFVITTSPIIIPASRLQSLSSKSLIIEQINGIQISLLERDNTRIDIIITGNHILHPGSLQAECSVLLQHYLSSLS